MMDLISPRPEPLRVIRSPPEARAGVILSSTGVPAFTEGLPSLSFLHELRASANENTRKDSSSILFIIIFFISDISTFLNNKIPEVSTIQDPVRSPLQGSEDTYLIH